MASHSEPAAISNVAGSAFGDGDSPTSLRFRVPGRRVGLATAASHFDSHEACLKLRLDEEEGIAARQYSEAEGDGDGDDDAEAVRVFHAARPLRSNREWRDALFGPNRHDGGPVRLPRLGESRPFVDDPGAGCLMPALSGEWLCGRLLSRAALEREGLDGATVGGAVMWHANSVGKTAGDAAALIREMCMAGNSYYNDNDETDEFLSMGGRIVGRYFWEGSTVHPLNAALPEGSDLKFEEDDYEGGDIPWGPVFMMASAEKYLSDGWPGLRELSNDYGRDVEEAAITSLGEDVGIHAFFRCQEYLAGRIFTTSVQYTDGDGEKRTGTAVRMLVLHTYSAPEAFDDACVEGSPVGRLPVMLLRKVGALPEWTAGRTNKELQDVLGSVSARRAMALLEEGINRNSRPNGDTDAERCVALRRIIPILVTEVDKPPSLVSVLYMMIDSFNFDIFEAYIHGLRESGVLPRLVSEMEGATRSQNWRKLTASVLLGFCRTVDSARALVEAGVPVTDKAVRAAMDRPEVFFYLFDKLTKGLFGLLRAAKQYDFAVCAVRGLHWSVLSDLVWGMSTGEKGRLLSATDLPVLEPYVDPGTGEAGREYGTGSVGALALGAYLNCVASTEILGGGDREGYQREAFRRTIRVLVAELGVGVDSCCLPNGHPFWSIRDKFQGYRRGQESETILPAKAEEVIEEARAYCEQPLGNQGRPGRLEYELNLEDENIASSGEDAARTFLRRVVRHWFSCAREEMDILC